MKFSKSMQKNIKFGPSQICMMSWFDVKYILL